MYRISDGTIRLYTYRDGVFSSMGHDLRLTLERFEISVDGASVQGVFQIGSLVVDGAIKNGRLSRLTLVKKDRLEIHKLTLGKKVLDAGHFPEARFEGSATELEPARYAVTGSLELVGRKAELQAEIAVESDRLRGEVTLTPSRWGIQPFRTLLGTMKVQDRVDVVFDLPDVRQAAIPCEAAS